MQIGDGLRAMIVARRSVLPNYRKTSQSRLRREEVFTMQGTAATGPKPHSECGLRRLCC